MEHLSIPELLLLHARLMQSTGGSRDVREASLIESALARPHAKSDHEELYPDLWTKATALMLSLAQGRPFVDGNDRTALVATGIFLELNGHKLMADNAAALDLTRQVARGRIGLSGIADWLAAHSRPIEEE